MLYQVIIVEKATQKDKDEKGAVDDVIRELTVDAPDVPTAVLRVCLTCNIEMLTKLPGCYEAHVRNFT